MTPTSLQRAGRTWARSFRFKSRALWSTGHLEVFEYLWGFGDGVEKKILIFICFVYFIELNLIKLYLPFGSETVDVKPGVQGSRRTITKHSFNFIFNPTCKPLALSPISKAPSGPRGPCLVTRHTPVLTGPHALPCSHCFLHLFFFPPFFFSVIENYSVPGLGLSRGKKTQSFFSRSYREGMGDHRQVTGVAGSTEGPPALSWRPECCLEERLCNCSQRMSRR